MGEAETEFSSHQEDMEGLISGSVPEGTTEIIENTIETENRRKLEEETKPTTRKL
jgi:hypothetical protein